MAIIHNLGFPRIGAQRELKFALESYWTGQSDRQALRQTGAELRQRHWQLQSALDWVPVGDFSFYDQVLDTSVMLGHLPERAQRFEGDPLDNYFRVARGRSACCGGAESGAHNGIAAGEMTKWFDTNYHYIVPEFSQATTFRLAPENLLAQLTEARAQGVAAKPVIIGPLTYLALGKSKDGRDKLSLLPELLGVYRELLSLLAAHDVDWVQIDEPLLVTDLNAEWQAAYAQGYAALSGCGVRLLLTTYFGGLADNLPLVCQLPVDGVHLDAVNAPEEAVELVARLRPEQVISLGVVNGRNIWKSDLDATLTWLSPLAEALGDRLWLAPSCSLLHVPVDLDQESELDADVKSWLAFACQKLTELQVLGAALTHGRDSVREALSENRAALVQRRQSPKVHRPLVRQQVAALTADDAQRRSVFSQRQVAQEAWLALPAYPTTTIGSFPQTTAIRLARRQYKSGEIDARSYQRVMRIEIERCIREQEALGLDVLVHGEAERNDMVEYFGEQLEGYAFSRFGWVQSYGSRCVKPPILFGDIQRSQAMTVSWALYAQSLTDKVVKGMVTGPVTILNWSFVRDDQPRSETCKQLALAIRQEVQDLAQAGIRIIQIDEAALREGLPLRRCDWPHYLDWAVFCYGVSANGVDDEIQIHTHMCYSEFNDILPAIAAMDADVITIETSRSDMELLEGFERFHYPNAIGPGVYDIHSPNVPTVAAMVALMNKAATHIPVSRLWVNPDCGLKTRQWDEVRPALKNMVEAARCLRHQLVSAPQPA